VGLSAAATTEAVQRLTIRGLLERRTDPGDRRRALISLTPTTAECLDGLLAPVRRAGEDLLRGYTDAELDLLARFLERGRQLQLAEAERLRGSRRSAHA
jgi:DNA-binding MarR family transcriptional regulator